MKEYIIEIEEFQVERVESINLIFENCNEIQIFSEEIVDMKFDYYNELQMCGDGIKRKIKSGFIKIQINKKYNKRRKIVINFDDNEKANDKKIMDRLVGDCEITFITIVNKINNSQETLQVPFEFFDEEASIPSVCSTCSIDKDQNLSIMIGEASEFV